MGWISPTFEDVHPVALVSLPSMMRLMAQWIIATPVSGSRS